MPRVLEAHAPPRTPMLQPAGGSLRQLGPDRVRRWHNIGATTTGGFVYPRLCPAISCDFTSGQKARASSGRTEFTVGTTSVPRRLGPVSPLAAERGGMGIGRCGRGMSDRSPAVTMSIDDHVSIREEG